MRTIEIEDDVYKHLLENTSKIGESASEILRRLLRISGKQSRATEYGEISKTEISECLESTRFNAQQDVVDKFLHILSYIYQKNPEQFEKVLTISGKRRKYFARTSEELIESGKSVYPKQIPNSPFWVITNNDSPKKKSMLQDAMKVLGYSNEAIKQAGETIASI